MPTNDTNPDVLYIFYGKDPDGGTSEGLFHRWGASTWSMDDRFSVLPNTMILVDSSCQVPIEYKFGTFKGVLPTTNGPVLRGPPGTSLTLSTQHNATKPPKGQVNIGIITVSSNIGGDLTGGPPHVNRPPLPTAHAGGPQPLDHGAVGPQPLKPKR